MNENVKYWINTADYDIKTAKAMLKTGRYLYVGLMCHQAVEKTLKAVIARGCAEGDFPPKIHHLLKLASTAGLLDSITPELLDFLKELNPMNLEARYPEHKDQVAAGLSKIVCADLIKRTEEMADWIKKRL